MLTLVVLSFTNNRFIVPQTNKELPQPEAVVQVQADIEVQVNWRIDTSSVTVACFYPPTGVTSSRFKDLLCPGDCSI